MLSELFPAWSGGAEFPVRLVKTEAGGSSEPSGAGIRLPPLLVRRCNFAELVSVNPCGREKEPPGGRGRLAELPVATGATVPPLGEFAAEPLLEAVPSY